MKINLSEFLRWGGRKVGAAGSGKGAHGSVNGQAEWRGSARLNMTGAAALHWVGGGQAEAQGIEPLDGATGGIIRTRASRPVPVGSGAWLTGPAAQPAPALVRSCEQAGQVWLLDLESLHSPAVHEGWGAACAQWIEDGRLFMAPASARSSQPGCLEINAAASVSAGSLALLSGAEASCLFLVRESRPYGERYLLEAEAVSTALARGRF